jgi:hypothetical protein
MRELKAATTGMTLEKLGIVRNSDDHKAILSLYADVAKKVDKLLK